MHQFALIGYGTGANCTTALNLHRCSLKLQCGARFGQIAIFLHQCGFRFAKNPAQNRYCAIPLINCHLGLIINTRLLHRRVHEHRGSDYPTLLTLSMNSCQTLIHLETRLQIKIQVLHITREATRTFHLYLELIEIQSYPDM